MTISTTGGSAVGAMAGSGGTIAMRGGAITTSGNAAVALRAIDGGVIQSSGPLTLVTSGANAIAVQALSGGTIDIADASIRTAADGADGLVADGAGSTITATNTTITTMGNSFSAIAGNGAGIALVNPSIVSSGTGVAAFTGGTVTLDNGSVTTSASGDAALWAEDAGSTITATGTAVSATGAGAWGVLVGRGAAISLTDASISAAGIGAEIFAGGAAILNNTTVATSGASAHGAALSGSSSLTMTGGSITANGVGASALFSATGINTAVFTDSALTSARGDGIHVAGGTLNATLSGSSVTGGPAVLRVINGGILNLTASASTLNGTAVTEAGSTSNVVLQNGAIWNLTGDSNVTSLASLGSSIVFSAPVNGAFKTLTAVQYVGAGGALGLNTILGSDNSPSDKLVINGGTATGRSFLRFINAGGSGVQTTGNGILVVNAANGGSTAPGAFALAGEARGGALTYGLFRGGLNGSDPDNWFLRSSFSPPGGGEGGGPVIPPDVLPPEPPPEQLPPGAYPIIGPEIATYGVVQPMARQLGLATLGTLHERIGDTLTVPHAGSEGLSRSAWARAFGQQVDNRYLAYADPRAEGRLAGFQAGLDLLRAEWAPGHRDVAGVYFAYANADADVTGLVTNEAATNYVLRKTGRLDLNAWSGGAYWTHYGPTDWYLDAVVQATAYEGKASTIFANLSTNGVGFVSSLELGYPIRLPAFGPGFVLEPQAQIAWQHVSFDNANDGLGDVALGSTSGTSARVGLRGRWTIVTGSGQVWQPYVRANLWHDWGAQATTTFSGVDLVPLLQRATRLDLGAGVTTQINANLGLYAQASYQFALGDSDGGKRDGVKGNLGLRYTW